MGKKKRARPALRVRLPVQSADLQIDFWARLQQIRAKYLTDALVQSVRTLDIANMDRELEQSVGNERLSPLTVQGIRGEVFFPIPALLKVKPNLLGYYRLLYG